MYRNKCKDCAENVLLSPPGCKYDSVLINCLLNLENFLYVLVLFKCMHI